MSDGTREAIVAAVSLGVGWICRVVTTAFAAGRRDAELVSHKDLEKKLEGYARKDQLDEIKIDISEIKAELCRADAKQDKHHAQIIEALLRGRGE